MFVFFIILILLGIILFYPRVSGFANYVAYYQSPSQNGWWKRADWKRFGFPYYSYWESFKNPASSAGLINSEKKESPIMEYPPDTPAPTNFSLQKPYHLLSDEFTKPRAKESISCVNSRSCYAVNFERMVEKVGNYRQLTNNYKRGYPDSCSAPYQELILNFYKADIIKP